MSAPALLDGQEVAAGPRALVSSSPATRARRARVILCSTWLTSSSIIGADSRSDRAVTSNRVSGLSPRIVVGRSARWANGPRSQYGSSRTISEASASATAPLSRPVGGALAQLLEQQTLARLQARVLDAAPVGVLDGAEEQRYLVGGQVPDAAFGGAGVPDQRLVEREQEVVVLGGDLGQVGVVPRADDRALGVAVGRGGCRGPATSACRSGRCRR